MRDDRERLLDILEAIERVQKYAVRGRAVFDADELIQNWIVRHIQIIGEAAGKTSVSLRQRHPQVAWPEIVAVRNVLVHDYFGVDEDEVWTTVEFDLPKLKTQVEAILRELDVKDADDESASTEI